MSEEVRRIVKMLKEGRINEDEAVRLLDAATRTAPPQSEEGETRRDVRQQALDAARLARDRLNIPDTVWRLALVIGIAALVLVLLNALMRSMGIWHPGLLIAVPILALVVILAAEKKEASTPVDWAGLVRAVALLIAIPLLLLALLSVTTHFMGISSESLWGVGAFQRSAPILGVVPLLLLIAVPVFLVVLVLVIVAAVNPNKPALNWPGLIWRLALLVAIPLLVLFVVVVGSRVALF